MKYNNLPEHMRHGARLYIEEGIPPGHFLTAVLENNLVRAYSRADKTNTEAMRTWAVWLYSEVPGPAWGSPEKVQAWIEKGGLNGEQNQTRLED